MEKIHRIINRHEISYTKVDLLLSVWVLNTTIVVHVVVPHCKDLSSLQCLGLILFGCQVKEADGALPCEAGEPIECGSNVRLEHMITGKNLHSHMFQSPLSRNQEVCAARVGFVLSDILILAEGYKRGMVDGRSTPFEHIAWHEECLRFVSSKVLRQITREHTNISAFVSLRLVLYSPSLMGQHEFVAAVVTTGELLRRRRGGRWR